MNTTPTLELLSRSAQETESLGHALGSACVGGELFLLVGELGAGKTCFTKGLGRGLGCDPRQIKSASYTLLHRHRGRLDLNHFDVYFTDASVDLERNSLREFLERGEVVAVEWGDRFLEELPDERLEVEIRHESEETRLFRFQAWGEAARRMLAVAAETGTSFPAEP